MTTPARETSEPLATRERILAEAAILFAKRGFHGTSTRDIAAAVGIRQPSLFHHFPTKQGVLAELLDHDLQPALELIRRVRQTEAAPAIKLYAYVKTDIATLVSFPFDARGIYNDEILEGEAFTEQRRCRKAFHEEIEGLIAEGVDSTELRAIDVVFAQRTISALTKHTLFTLSAGRVADTEARPAEVADFVLLGLLTDSASLPTIRAEADHLIASLR